MAIIAKLAKFTAIVWIIKKCEMKISRFYFWFTNQ